ncbi:MAG TPA: hypothetical protein VE732_02850, partial [Nitrososphaera sp.]|nr:hypothetical protein [Nitrososphaera sp.]
IQTLLEWWDDNLTTHSTRRLDSIPFIVILFLLALMLYARRGLIRALDCSPLAGEIYSYGKKEVEKKK